MDKIQLAKTVTKLVAGSSVGKVVSTAIKTYVPAKNPIEQAQIAIGAVVISGMVVQKSNEYVGQNFDDFLLAINMVKQQRANQ